jgi:hypothetical protein
VSKVAAIPSVSIVVCEGGGFDAWRDGSLLGTWRTAKEAWQEATKGLISVAAKILDAVFRPEAPTVIWKRACNRLGKHTLDPQPLRVVTDEDAARHAAERDAEDPRPKVVLESGQLPRAVYDTLAALAEHAEVYRRSGSIVEPVTTRRPWQTQDSAPALHVVEVPPTVLTVRAGIACRFVRPTKKGGEADTDLAPKLAAVIAAEGARSNHLHVLSGVLEAPSLRPDGTIIRAKGYDAATGYYLAHEFELKGLKDEPTHNDSMAAYRKLEGLFSGDRDGKKGFAWKNGNKDAIVPIAHLLSALARPAIQPPKGCVPIFAYSASGKGAGKGTAVDIVFVIATGRPAAVMSWSNDEDEQDKRLGGVAFDAPTMISIDNVPEDVPFGHSRLDAALTSDETAFRVLGKTGNPILMWLTILCVTGNNLSTIGDICRRMLICYQCPDSEDPSAIPQNMRVIPNIVEHALEHREEYLVAALTILRHFCISGRKDMGCELGTFTKWAKLVGNAIALAGGGNVVDYLATQDSTSEAPTKAAIRELARCLAKMTDNGGVTAGYILDDLYDTTYLEKRRRNGDMAPDINRDPLRQAIETLCPSKGPPTNDPMFRLRFAKTLSRIRGQWHGGFQVDQENNPLTGKAYDVPRWVARKAKA